ncbi:MAG: GNAT family N-acetyltransferase [Micropepsaceae bacterium]
MPPSSERGPHFNLTLFVPAHLPELADLWISAWTLAMPSINFEVRRGWFVDHLVQLRDQGALVCCAFDAANGSMAGFVTLERASGLIDQLAVAPAFWGAGAAHQLLDWAKGEHAGTLSLDVNQDNARASSFYKREGFVRVSEGTNPNSGLKTWRYEWRPTLHVS